MGSDLCVFYVLGTLTAHSMRHKIKKTLGDNITPQSREQATWVFQEKTQAKHFWHHTKSHIRICAVQEPAHNSRAANTRFSLRYGVNYVCLEEHRKIEDSPAIQ